jgi:hypothetical protein
MDGREPQDISHRLGGQPVVLYELLGRQWHTPEDVADGLSHFFRERAVCAVARHGKVRDQPVGQRM